MAPRKRFQRFDPKKTKGPNLDEEITLLTEACKEFDGSQCQTFDEFPISRKTLEGLKKGGFSVPTEIQRDSIANALKGEDVLGAAKTGSGKTLAFVVPILEKLYKSKWSCHDGLGALVISPTRELAVQTFQVFKKVRGGHDFSIAAVIGGKDLQFELKRLQSFNIVVCTPGRLLHHLERNSELTLDQLQILVLDEADQILDLGFEHTVNAIIEYLPSERQTLLFSATQTKSARDLARLSLKQCFYVSANEHSEHSTPATLQQAYAVCNLEEKINTLWAFINNHSKKKILVFMSSCKQVKYLHTAFCRMRPQTNIFALSSKMHQIKRLETYDTFYRKQSAVLLATDVAARGLDFPGIHWVVQLDCPQDSKTYIHRVGRTARYENGGESLLILLPSEEEAMIDELNAKKIPITKIRSSKRSIETKLAVLVSRDVALKDSAQRAFVAYFKSVYLMKNKKIFDVQKLNKEEFAKSLGLAQAPRIRFLQAIEKQLSKTDAKTKTQERPNKTDKIDCSDESADELFSVKKSELFSDDLPNIDEYREETRSSKKKISTKKFLAKRKPNTRKVFDEDGEEIVANNDDDDDGGINIEKSKEMMKEADRIDKEVYRQKIKEEHKQKRLKEKELKRKRRKEKEGDESDESESEMLTKDEETIVPDTKKTKRNRDANYEMPLAEQEELAMRLLKTKTN